jgi:deoxyribodipyrimidine photolyase-related protein
MYADAIDWVTLPNTLGMVMHADARPRTTQGVVGTKPYAASGQYISRMSNYCQGCVYDPAKRAGAKACPFTVFYWDFLIRHGERFARNPRMTMMMKNAQKLSEETRVEITSSAAALREKMGITGSASIAPPRAGGRSDTLWGGQ